MKKSLTFIFALLLGSMLFITTSCSSSDSSKIYLATSPDYAPFEFVNSKNGEYVGADIELAKYIAEKLGKELVIDSMDFTTTLNSLQGGKDDFAISGYTYDKSRAENYEISIPYNQKGEGEQVLVVSKETAKKYSSLASLNIKDVVVTVQPGTTQSQAVAKDLTNVTVQNVDKIPDAVSNWLVPGKADALCVPRTVAEGIVSQNSDLVIFDEYLDWEDSAFYCFAKKGNTELMTSINEILKEVNEKGLYQNWLDDAKALQTQLGL